MSVFDMMSKQRGQKVNKAKMVGTQGTKFKGIREHFQKNLASVYKGKIKKQAKRKRGERKKGEKKHRMMFENETWKQLDMPIEFENFPADHIDRDPKGIHFFVVLFIFYFFYYFVFLLLLLLFFFFL